MYNARSLAFLLALATGISTAVILFLIADIDSNLLSTISVISFAITFAVSYSLLHFLVFKGVEDIYDVLNNVQGKSFSGTYHEEPKNPLKHIKEEIESFSSIKLGEIEDLKKSETFRKEFIADVSHELKTPIFAAQGFVHTLLDGAVEVKSVRDKFLKKAAKSLDGLDALVQDLLTLSQIETGDIKMKFDNIDLYSLCTEVVEQYEHRAAKRHITVKVKKPEQMVIVVADWLRITQVMTNLVSNAIKYSNEGSEVVIYFEFGERYIHTYVQDHGEGIPQEHLKRIFERFYRVEKSRSREKGGTGLGLAIVKHILEGHKSRAIVKSEPGKGSTFSFRLPAAERVTAAKAK